MLLLAALVASAQSLPAAETGAVAPRVQAQAIVRQTLEGKPLRLTRVRNSNGELVPARLAEFE